MASSPNHTTVYIPSGDNGIPLIRTVDNNNLNFKVKKGAFHSGESPLLFLILFAKNVVVFAIINLSMT